jgi:hypothetical protein
MSMFLAFVLFAALGLAPDVISMKNDWRRIFAFEQQLHEGFGRSFCDPRHAGTALR